MASRFKKRSAANVHFLKTESSFQETEMRKTKPVESATKITDLKAFFVQAENIFTGAVCTSTYPTFIATAC